MSKRSFAEFLESRPDRSLDRFVLLDAQDWMTEVQLDPLWREMTRTFRPSARVIFRTAAVAWMLICCAGGDTKPRHRAIG